MKYIFYLFQDSVLMSELKLVLPLNYDKCGKGLESVKSLDLGILPFLSDRGPPS